MKILSILFLAFLPASAWARSYDLYRADYFKGAFCSAIGGACAADADIVTSLFQNPATLTNGNPDWDFDGDISKRSNLEPGMNDGNNPSEAAGAGGIGYSSGKVGFGISALYQIDTVQSNVNITDALGDSAATAMTAKGYSKQLRFSGSFLLHDGLSIGATISLLDHSQFYDITGAPSRVQSSPDNLHLGYSLGTLARLNPKLWLGSWFRFPTTIHQNVSFTGTVGSTNLNYSENFAIHYPWIWATGMQWSVFPRWNLYLEGDVIGSTADGFLLSYNTLSANSDAGLLSKGRETVVEPHWGTRYALGEKQSFKLHFGGYHETGRVDGISGRLHTTGGLSYAFGDIVEVIGGMDLAKNYSQVIFTIR